MSKIFLSGIFVCLIVSIAFAQVFKTVNIAFTREIKKNGIKEVSRGHIYYNNKKTILKITDPISQWMIIDSKSIIIYYPVEKEAMKINCSLPVALPFLDLFINVINENFGLAELGYHVEKNEFKNDTLYTYWGPAEKNRGSMGQVIFALVNNKIVFSESKDPQGKTIFKTFYQDHITSRTKYIPLKMTILKFFETGITIEDIVYANPVFNQPLPKEIINFRIPDNITIEVIE